MLRLFVTKLQYPVVLGIPWLRLHDVSLRFGSHSVVFGSEHCRKHCNATKTPVPGLSPPPPAINPLKINLIGAGAFAHLTKRHKLQTFAINFYEVNQQIKDQAKDNWEKLIPEEYHKFLGLFSKKEVEGLPPHRSYDHSIPLRKGTTPPFSLLYKMSRMELETLKKYLEDNLSKKFIRHSSSPAGAPVLFVKKADRLLRLCVDYRGLNKITVKNRYPLLLIQEMLACLSQAKWFTKLDLRGAYNLV